MSVTDALKLDFATTASGYAAVVDGILDIRTAASGPNMTAYNALFYMDIAVMGTCCDEDCDCYVKALTLFRPDVKIVPVRMEVTK